MSKTTNKNNKKKSGGNKLMKGKVTKILGLIALVAIVVAGIFYYNNKRYEYWNDNQLRILTDFDVIVDDEKAASALDQERQDEKEASAKVMKKVDGYKKGIIDFFKDEYNVDVSERLNKLQTVYIYSSDEYKGQVLYGCVEKGKDEMHLSRKILSDNVLMRSVFTHEAIHYIGIELPGEDDIGKYCIEGLTDAVAEDCVKYQNKKFKGSEYYEFAKSLWRQILVVDSEIVKDAVTKENYDIMSNFDSKLKNVKQSCLKISNISENLENCIATLFQGVSTQDAYRLEVQAQNIVISYIKTFSPSRKQIEKIREYYMLEDYENVAIKKIGNEYFIA